MAYTKFLRLPEVEDRTGKSKSTIWAAIKSGTFPKPIKLGPRSVGWVESEIEAHNQACIDASRPEDSEGRSE
jgi:prophage regulatory protein